MKVLLTNGSPNEMGCTYTALREVAKTLTEENIETEIFWIGRDPIAGCIACHACEQLGHCIIEDRVEEFLERAKTADGFVFGSPVHYAGAAGPLVSLLNRAFVSDLVGNGNRTFYLKPAAAVVSARRAGTTAAFSQLNHYFTLQEMPVVSSRYWNMVHGDTPAEVEKDAEGLQIMRVLARNMAYLLRCREAAHNAGIPLPKREDSIYTNFIR